MTNYNVQGVVESIGRFNASVKSLVARNRTRLFKVTGEQQGQLKEWYGRATTVNGEFSFDCSAAGFTEILHVDPRSVQDEPNFNKQLYTSLSSVTPRLVKGRVGNGTNKTNGVLILVKIVGL